MFKHEEIIAMLLADEAKKTSTGSKWFDGTTWHNGKPQSFESGSFVGKAGTMRRSNKGRSYRAPNGSRRYVIDYNTEVIAYVP